LTGFERVEKVGLVVLINPQRDSAQFQGVSVDETLLLQNNIEEIAKDKHRIAIEGQSRVYLGLWFHDPKPMMYVHALMI